MKEIEVTNGIGFRVYDDNNNLIGYKQGASGEGYIFKDEDAFATAPNEICYISEYGFDYADKDGILSSKYALQEGESRNTIRKQIRSAWGEDYLLTPEQVDYIAEDLFGLADWAYICTYLAENFEIEDLIEFGYEDGRGGFTKEQYDAVMNGMTPAEFCKD